MKRVILLLVASVLLSSCNVDTGQLWANFDWCGNRTSPETSTGFCKVWWQLGNGDITEEDFINEVNARYNATSTAQAMSATPTRIPTPKYEPINTDYLTPTPMFSQFISPLPTPTLWYFK